LVTRELVCRQAVELVTAYLDGALSRRDRGRLERHLADCGNCSAYLQQIKFTIAATGAISPDALSEAARSDLIDLFLRYQGEDGSGAGEAGSPGSSTD